MRSKLSLLIVCFTTVALVLGAAATASTRFTQGDAQAVLRSFGDGGWAVLLHSEEANGAPASGLCCGGVAIRPFNVFDGTHYCSLDWHAIVLADVEAGPWQAAAEAIADTSVSFTLDGELLTGVTQTAVARFLNPERYGLTEAYDSQWGKVMAPSDLAVGAHTLGYLASSKSGSVPDDTGAITFFVDPAGTGACL